MRKEEARGRRDEGERGREEERERGREGRGGKRMRKREEWCKQARN